MGSKPKSRSGHKIYGATRNAPSGKVSISVSNLPTAHYEHIKQRKTVGACRSITAWICDAISEKIAEEQGA